MGITLYSAFWCPDCRATKRFLAKVTRHTGKRPIPQLVIDGEWVQPYRPSQGFRYEEVAEILGIHES